MLLLNKYDYLLQRSEIKTLLYKYNIKDIPFIDGKLYQLGVGQDSIFFSKEQLEALFVGQSTLVCSKFYSHWELYLKELFRLFTFWQLSQKFFMSSHFNLLLNNYKAFIPFTYFFSVRKRKTALRALTLGSYFLHPISGKLLDSLWRPRFFRLRKQLLRRRRFKKYKYLRRISRKWVGLSLRKIHNKWTYLFIALFLLKSFFRPFPIHVHLAPLRLQRKSGVSLFLQRLGFLDNFKFTTLLFCYTRFFFSITFWKFFRKVRKKIIRKRLFLRSVEVDSYFFEQIFNYWLIFVIYLFTRLGKLNSYFSWYFSAFQGVYLPIYLGKHYAQRKHYTPRKPINNQLTVIGKNKAVKKKKNRRN